MFTVSNRKTADHTINSVNITQVLLLTYFMSDEVWGTIIEYREIKTELNL